MTTRSPNWTDTEKNILLSEFERYKEILLPKFGEMCKFGTKKEAWKILTLAINDVSLNIDRTTKEVQKKWQNMLTDAKHDLVKYKTSLAEDEDPIRGLPDLSRRILDIYGENLNSELQIQHHVIIPEELIKPESIDLDEVQLESSIDYSASVIIERNDAPTTETTNAVKTDMGTKRKRQVSEDTDNEIIPMNCFEGSLVRLKRLKLEKENENLLLEQEKLKLEKEKLTEEIEKIALEKEVLALTKCKLQMEVQSSLYPLFAASMQGPQFLNKLFGELSNDMEGKHFPNGKGVPGKK